MNILHAEITSLTKHKWGDPDSKRRMTNEEKAHLSLNDNIRQDMTKISSSSMKAAVQQLKTNATLDVKKYQNVLNSLQNEMKVYDYTLVVVICSAWNHIYIFIYMSTCILYIV